MLQSMGSQKFARNDSDWTELHFTEFIAGLHVSTSLNFCFPPLISVQFSCSVVSDSLRPHELQHDRLPCPSPTLRAYYFKDHLLGTL